MPLAAKWQHNYNICPFTNSDPAHNVLNEQVIHLTEQTAHSAMSGFFCV